MKVLLPVWHVDDNPIDVRLAKLFRTYQDPGRWYPAGVLLKFVECYKMETNASVVKSANWTW